MNHTAILKTGQSIVQLKTGLTAEFSSVATQDYLVMLKPYIKDEEQEHCRNAQIRLARMWAADMAKSGKGFSSDPKDFYIEFKGKFLAPLVAADDEEFAGLWARVKATRQKLDRHEYYTFADKALSITDATVKQVSEALNQWQAWMIEHGIEFRDPEELKFARQIEGYMNMPEVQR